MIVNVAQALRSQKTNMAEGLIQALELAETDAGVDAKVSAPPSKKRANVKARASDAARTAKHSKQCHRRAEQERADCDKLLGAGCWERGDESAEALEWNI